MERFDRPPTLVEAVADQIKKEIIRGNLLPGEALPEIELGKALNVSRGTVREALRLLEKQGLTEIYSHRGAFVYKLSPEKVREIYTLRGLLEPYAVRLSLENGSIDPEYLEEMHQLVDKMRELEASGDYAEMIETDIQFHEMSGQRCGHALLLEVLHNLQSLTLMFILNTKLYRSDMVTEEVSHRAIYEGIATGDPQLAEEIVRQHIFDAGSSLLKRMEQEWVDEPT